MACSRSSPTNPPGSKPLRLLALPFALAGLYHLVGLVAPALTEPAPAWRHALFVLVNGLAAFGLVRFKRAYLPLYVLLALQQVAGHGRDLASKWLVDRHVDWPSIAVLLFMPALLAVLWRRRPEKV